MKNGGIKWENDNVRIRISYLLFFSSPVRIAIADANKEKIISSRIKRLAFPHYHFPI